MHIHDVLLLLASVDPNAGTAKAQQGAAQRLSDPTYYDVIFPAIAFLLVIVLPVTTALWVIVKTATEKTPEPDEK
jgi:hypothetical protein